MLQLLRTPPGRSGRFLSARGSAPRLLATKLCTMLDWCSGKISIGGHRGVGENLWTEEDADKDPAGSEGARSISSVDRVTPAIRENTMLAFRRAQELGVSFVEFDIQVLGQSGRIE